MGEAHRSCSKGSPRQDHTEALSRECFEPRLYQRYRFEPRLYKLLAPSRSEHNLHHCSAVSAGACRSLLLGTNVPGSF
eukprot:3462104-Prymnesium_polylepis.1